VLIVDDFLASGQTIWRSSSCCARRARSSWALARWWKRRSEGGREALKDVGVPIESLAVITAMKDGVITFGE